MRLLPKTPRGTWLLAGAVWLTGVGALWWMLSPTPCGEWRVPFDRERRHDSVPTVFAVVPDRRSVAVVGGIVAWGGGGPVNTDDPPDWPAYRGPVQILDFGADGERGRFLTPDDVFQEVRASPDGRWLGLTGPAGRNNVNQNVLVLIDLERGRRIDLPDAAYRPGVARRFAFVPDGLAIVYAWRDGDNDGLRIWDLAAERMLAEIKGARPPVVVAEGGRALAFVATPQGRQVIRIAELPSLRTLAEVPTEDQRVYDLNLSADGRRAAAVHYHRTGAVWSIQSVHCWDTATGAELIGRSNGAGIRLTADGETLVTFSVNSNLVAWDVSSGRPKWQRDLPAWTGADLREVAIEPLRGCVTLVRAHESPRDVIGSWADRAGIIWPFTRQRLRYSSELIDIESGRSVMRLPFLLDRAFSTPDRLIGVASRFDRPADEAALSFAVWDLPPRKPLKWFAAETAPLTLALVLLARRRVLRLCARAN
jgi:hypothetical protein